MRLASRYLRELAYYQEYHKHPWNWRIHAVAVPLEWLTMMAAIALLTAPWHWVLAFGVGTYQALAINSRSYFLACSSMAVQLGMAWGSAKLLMINDGTWLIALLLSVLYTSSWCVQVFIGHYLIEKNQPGIANQLTLDSILFSVPMAWDVANKSSCTHSADESSNLTKFCIRTFSDTFPPLQDIIIYVFQHPNDNAEGAAASAVEMWWKLRDKGARILVFDIDNSQLDTPIPHYAGSKLLLQLLKGHNGQGIPETAIILKPWKFSFVHTLVEAQEAARVAFDELRVSAIVVSSVAIHLPRAFLSMLSVVSQMEREQKSGATHQFPVYSSQVSPLSWSAEIFHNQGVVFGSRDELLDSELGRIAKYHKKGDLIAPSEALEFLRRRDAFHEPFEMGRKTN